MSIGKVLLVDGTGSICREDRCYLSTGQVLLVNRIEFYLASGMNTKLRPWGMVFRFSLAATIG